ncbi:MAG: glycosyltransferase family 4 protein [Actinomycetota bacterium]
MPRTRRRSTAVFDHMDESDVVTRPTSAGDDRSISTRESLRIAMIAPPWFELPPRGYGGIEWMCYWLVEELVKRGHDVTLVASGQNHTGARFIQTYTRPPSEYLGTSIPEIVHAGVASRLLHDVHFDVVHDHSFAGPLLARARSCATVVTAHGPVNGELEHYYAEIGTAVSLVAISTAQRDQRPDLPWMATIHNAIPTSEYPFRQKKDDYALWLGRMSPEKGPDIAIDAARQAGRRLIMAGKCNEPAEKQYFDTKVRPRLAADVEWIGEADTECKKQLLSRASCLLFPIQWAEPFGIVMVEAMACGTPVVALRDGSVPEVIVDGVTGYVCERPGELAGALRRTETIDPHACRRHAVAHFEVATMASLYESVYQGLQDRRHLAEGELRLEGRRRDPEDVGIRGVVAT